MSHRERVAVVGGGIAGLAAAYELVTASEPSPEVLLFEAQGRLGGKIETVHSGGLVLELGPDSFLTTKPWARQLCAELGLEGELVGTNPEQRDVFILHRGALVPLPEGLIMMVPTDLLSMATTPLLSPLGKARAALEPLVPETNGREAESIQSFVSRRFGPELYDHIVEPMMSGIYAGDGSALSIEATFPRLAQWEREHGSVLRGALKLRASRLARSKESSKRRSLFLSLKEGLGQLVVALEEHLEANGVEIHKGRAVTALEPVPSGYEITDLEGRKTRLRGAVLATPAFVTARLFEPWAPELARLLQRIGYAATATVNLAYEDEAIARKLTGYGYVIPAVEDRSALACTWTSTKFPGRAPDGAALVRVFLGRAGQAELVFEDDETLLRLAQEELRDTLGIDQPPSFSRIKRWPRAMPQYNVGHLALVEELEAAISAVEGLQLAGAGYRGIGVPDCVLSGREAARSLLHPTA